MLINIGQDKDLTLLLGFLGSSKFDNIVEYKTKTIKPENS